MPNQPDDCLEEYHTTTKDGKTAAREPTETNTLTEEGGFLYCLYVCTIWGSSQLTLGFKLSIMRVVALALERWFLLFPASMTNIPVLGVIVHGGFVCDCGIQRAK